MSNTRCHSKGHKMRIARIEIRVDSPGTSPSSLHLHTLLTLSIHPHPDNSVPTAHQTNSRGAKSIKPIQCPQVFLCQIFLCQIFLTRYGEGTEAEIQLSLKWSSRFQRLFLNPSWLVWGRASRHQKLAPTFPGIDSCLMVTKWDFLEMEASLWLNGKSQNVAKGW